jgi:hypothetical protein
MNTLIYQIDDESCSLAALKMILIATSHKKAFAYLDISLHHPPYSLLEMSNQAKEYGFALTFLKADGSDISYPNGLKKPFLVLLKGSKSTHLVMIKHLSKKRVYYLDPAEGKVHLRKEEFLKRWVGVYGVCQRLDEVPLKLPPIPKLYPSSWASITTLCLIIFSLCLAGGFYYLNQDGNFIIPIVCFTLAAVVEISREALNSYFSRKFDQKWLTETYDPSNERFKNNYLHYCEFKKMSLQKGSNAISFLLFIMALEILIGLNCPYFFLASGILLVSLFFYEKYHFHQLKKKGRELEEDESILWKDGTRSKKINMLGQLSVEASSFSKSLVYSRIVLAFIVVALSFIPLISAPSVTLNYYLFHLFALLSVGEAFLHVLQYAFEDPIRSASKGYFLEYFAKKRERDEKGEK